MVVWQIVKDLAGYINNFTNNVNYCGELWSKAGEYQGTDDWYDYYGWGTYTDPIHDWALKSDCNGFAWRPFVCETPLSKRRRSTFNHTSRHTLVS